MSTGTMKAVKRLHREHIEHIPRTWKRPSLRAFARQCQEPQAQLWLARKARA